MKSNVIKISILEILCILFAIPSIFFGVRYNEYLIPGFMLLLFAVSIYLLGFKKDKLVNSKKTVIVVSVVTISILFTTYAIGFLTGFVKSPYNRGIMGILLNTGSILLLVLGSELFRYQYSTKGNKFNFVLGIIALIMIDVVYNINFYNFVDNFVLLEFICVVVLPSISKNIVLSLLAKRYGYKVTIAYSAIMAVYEYVVPITPSYDSYLRSIISIIIPIINMLFVNFYLREAKKEDTRNKNIGSRIFVILCVIFLVFIIGIYSNLFRYWVATIASGSMSPTIEVGDIVVVDKYYAENPQELVVGDVIVFKVKNTLYTHRIISIVVKNNNYYIRTKGDYKDNAEDSWVVLRGDIIGKVNFKIKYLGLPSVWLHNLLKGD